MPFLLDTDYKAQITDGILDLIIEGDETIRQQAELAAQEEMESYLRDRFDVAAIFGAVDPDRSPLIILYLIDMVVYHLLSRTPGNALTQVRIDRYDMAINWLDKVSLGKLTPNLPPKQTEPGINDPFFLVGSNTKRTSDW